MAKKASNYIIKELEKMATDYFQKSNDDYPKSDKPDAIAVAGYSNNYYEVTASFKGAEESLALAWIKEYLRDYSVYIEVFTVYQTGDSNDWVEASAIIPIRER